MVDISPLATVSPKAVLGDGVTVGPYAYIEEDVQIGEGTKILPHAVIFDHVRMGRDCQVFPGAVVGGVPQDLKFKGELSYVEIGDRVVIRESATVNRGTAASGKALTRVGNDTFLMSYTHVAHDCRIGEHCILTSYSAMAGETDMDDWAILGGGTMAHQFSKIGRHAMVGGGCTIVKDVPPYSLCGRDPLCYAGVNIVGLRRRNFSLEVIRNIKEIYNTIFYSRYNITDGCARVEEAFPDSEEKRAILDFIRGSKRGIVRAVEIIQKPIDDL